MMHLGCGTGASPMDCGHRRWLMGGAPIPPRERYQCTLRSSASSPLRSRLLTPSVAARCALRLLARGRPTFFLVDLFGHFLDFAFGVPDLVRARLHAGLVVEFG